MRSIALTLVAALLLTGCGQTVERLQRKAQAERIIERTITKPEVSTVVVREYVTLPPELLKECGITQRRSAKVKEYVRVADTNTAYLKACKEQVDAIRKLQPKK